ncbi:hypothetical protein ACP70R_026342 [Stipagrostis hirtigluma subsp. patula]
MEGEEEQADRICLLHHRELEEDEVDEKVTDGVQFGGWENEEEHASATMSEARSEEMEGGTSFEYGGTAPLEYAAVPLPLGGKVGGWLLVHGHAGGLDADGGAPMHSRGDRGGRIARAFRSSMREDCHSHSELPASLYIEAAIGYIVYTTSWTPMRLKMESLEGKNRGLTLERLSARESRLDKEGGAAAGS